MNINELISKNFELENLPYISKEDLLQALALKIKYMLQYQTEELFSRLYRLDIFEEKIKAAMDKGGEISLNLAKLIIDRQLEKEQSKKANPPSRTEDEELAW